MATQWGRVGRIRRGVGDNPNLVSKAFQKYGTWPSALPTQLAVPHAWEVTAGLLDSLPNLELLIPRRGSELFHFLGTIVWLEARPRSCFSLVFLHQGDSVIQDESQGHLWGLLVINECVRACLCYLIDMNRNQMFKEKRRQMCLAAWKEVLGRNCVSGVY